MNLPIRHVNRNFKDPESVPTLIIDVITGINDPPDFQHVDQIEIEELRLHKPDGITILRRSKEIYATY